MSCPKCNTPLTGNEAFCPNCGVFLSQETPMAPCLNEPSQPHSTESTHTDSPWLTSNTSLNSSSSPQYTHAYYAPNRSSESNTIPPEVKKWNWGAFFFNAMWGIGNYNYLPLLCLIPIFNIIWMFVCGAKGNEWAWKSGQFDNLEDFIATQETWNRAGLYAFIITSIITILGIVIILSNLALLIPFFYFS